MSQSVDNQTKQVRFWLSQLQIKTVQNHPPIRITDKDEEVLEKVVVGFSKLLAQAELKGRMEEIKWGKSQICDLPKSHVGRSFYTRNTAFKNYAVKFWNSRVKLVRDKFDDRLASLKEKN